MNIPIANTSLDAALSYAAAGWQVFPCHPNDKHPMLPKESAPGAKDGGLWLATTDEAILCGWWRTRAGAMVGVRMGTGCGAFALDFDPYTDAETGEIISFEDLLAQAEEILGERLPATLTSETPRGGRHMLFRPPEGVALEDIGNSRGVLPRHIDVRGNGGYIVVAPSVRRGPKAVADGCDGVAYRWLDAAAEVAVAPMVLVDALLRRGRFVARPAASPPTPAQRLPVAASDEDAAVRRYALAALDNACGRVRQAGPGHRNETINNEALGIGHLVGAGAIDRSTAYGALYAAAASWGIAATDKALKPGGTLDRALDTGAGDPFDTSDIRRKARERADRYGGGARLTPPAGDYSDLPPAPSPRAAAPPVLDGEDAEDPGSDEDGCDTPSRALNRFDTEVVSACSKLDHSDTDNGHRLRLHFGDDLRVMQRRGVRNTEYLFWVGTHWDLDTGQDKAFALSQEVGGLIGLEADYLDHTPQEKEAINAGADAENGIDDADAEIAAAEKALKALGSADTPDRERVEAQQKQLQKARARRRRLDEMIEAAAAAKSALQKRQVARRKFGISSKNKARLEAMLSCAAPWLTVKPALFNADPLRVATETHTLVFGRDVDPENPDVGGTRYVATLDARKGHDPVDLVTFIVPHAYDEAATCPKWRAFMERFLPIPGVRRFWQVYAGLGLLGETVQKLVFNYGNGANGKSVAMQTIYNVLGDLAVNLEPESIIGVDVKAGGAASPDLIRLFGKRFLRISELPKGVPLKEALVKKITGGGEELSVRGLFQGMIDFIPTFVAMMSGNDYPRIDGTDHGIWRRLAVVHWPIKIPDEEQMPFDQVIDGFRPEYSGILNWLVEGAKIYLAEGLIVPPEVRAATEEYRSEMDPTVDFISDCVERVEGHSEKARALYEAYVSYSMANGVKPVSETKFGTIMKTKFVRNSERTRSYLDCRLHDVPDRPEAPYGGGSVPRGEFMPDYGDPGFAPS
jgi:putative DNA primase/helicase